VFYPDGMTYRTSKMRRIIVFYLLSIIGIPALYGQKPVNWKVIPSSFNNSMVITAVLNMQSTQSRDPEDVVAAFIGNEVRGVASSSVYINSKDIYVASLIVYSNDINALVTFKLFNTASNTVSNAVIAPIVFEADGIVGSLEAPLVIKDNNVPTELNLSKTIVNENLPAEALVGIFEVVDLDVADTHVFSLVNSNVFEDNSFFEIKNNSLYTKSMFVYDDKSSYTINVQAEDSKKGKIVKTFIVFIKKDEIGDVFEFNNLITHNGDGYNDVLKINRIDFYVDYNLFIYNKRGQLVYNTNNYHNDWNGADNPDGVYYLYFSGKNQAGKLFTYKEALRIINN
jgi:gliding motility-associated-like protein